MKLEFEDKIKNLIPHFGKSVKDLFTFKELEQLLNFRPVLGQKRFIPCLTGTRYTWVNSGWSTDNNAWPISIVKKILKEHSAYIQDCSRVNEKINLFAQNLEVILKASTDCHIYFSLNKNIKSFGKHKDTAHNTIVVCEGKIKCEVWTDNGIISNEMSKGDYVFIPEGFYHKITPLTDKRLSCSFPTAPNEKVFFDEREWYKIC